MTPEPTPTAPPGPPTPTGGFTELDGERYYRIDAYDRMSPFFMSIPSESDLWMFITSTGGLTAGRVDPDGSLFPYETVDRLHDAHHHTGPITLVRATAPSGAEHLWQPFATGAPSGVRLERAIYKSTVGDRVVFEETNHDLALTFRYRWASSDATGFVRTADLIDTSGTPRHVAVLDGLRNVLPHGVPLALMQQSSCLVDAYKRTDLDPDIPLAIFSLTARIVDRAEAAEALRANVVWSDGLDGDVCLSIDAVDAFRRGEPLDPVPVLTGRRGHYLETATVSLSPGGRARWHVVADVGLGHPEIAALRLRLRRPETLDATIDRALSDATRHLRSLVASADGVQLTAHEESSEHHFANVLFNVMRGGVFVSDHDVPTDDLRDFLRTRNRAVLERHAELLAALPVPCTIHDLVARTERIGDPDLRRLALEYLPIMFGRRHGDPSRPWNRFAIHVADASGRPVLRYEGNWRDIFQNWEALCTSFPGFLPNVVAKFVNASTVDGFNPYRVNRDGIDWEVVDPDDPWSYIGYWGDHQIVYLLRLIEWLDRIHPSRLIELLDAEIFSYADVPYRLAPYAEILGDPHSTITFDTERAARIEARVARMGTDGKLLAGAGGSVHHVNLLEKLLVPALSKLSNLVADGGIWMNTQRPEWNDANNALVGHGVSMVTLCHLRRYLHVLRQRLEASDATSTRLSTEVAAWLRRLDAIFVDHRPLLERATIDDRDRRRVLDALGEAFSEYRERVYAHGFSGTEAVSIGEIVAFSERALGFLDHAIAASRRPDGLHHAYNLLRLDTGTAAVDPLYEMLEGQVAVLSAGVLPPADALELVERLFESPLYREDQKSFMLYPERELPAFVDRNVVPGEHVARIPLLTELLEAGDGAIVTLDALGTHRFNADFANARDVSAALDRLGERPGWTERVARDRERVLALFEAVFDHHAFTGRSGTMYAYEGLGCVYWHMVAKLLVAVQEIALDALEGGSEPEVADALARTYYRIRSGLGFERPALDYGAFPTDPYSHTPPHAGAQQPGMTGQVKEEILTRLGELGVRIEGGRVRFRPRLLRVGELLTGPTTLELPRSDGDIAVEVPAGGLAFTYCSTPVIYEVTEGTASITTVSTSGEVSREAGDRLDPERSRALLERTGTLARIHVTVPAASLHRG